jgi:hypothetical protein
MASAEEKSAEERGDAEVGAAATSLVRLGYCGMPNAAEPARQKFAPSKFQ